ncbi:MAG: AAA family ATPase, partial [Chloroflexia bacterium]
MASVDTGGQGRGGPLIVGRERELATLRERLGAALAGRGGLVLIGGEAGIGKTTLAEAALREATEGGAAVLVGRCYDLTETPPYGPWRDLFAHLPAEGERFGGSLEGEAGELSNQGALFDRVRAFFAELAARQPIVAFLDDVHWADPASLDLLRFLARELARLPMLLLVTYRADELTRRHPLYALLPLLVREARAERLDLRRLGRDEARALVRAGYALPAPDEGRL